MDSHLYLGGKEAGFEETIPRRWDDLIQSPRGRRPGPLPLKLVLTSPRPDGYSSSLQQVRTMCSSHEAQDGRLVS